MTRSRDPNAIQPDPLVVSRVFAAPRATVFEAWSSADHIKRWFSPKHFTVPEATVDFRPGGVCDICMRAPNGQEFWSRGRYIEIVPAERLVFELGVIGDEGTPMFKAHTTVTFEDAEGGTRVTVRQAYEMFDERASAHIGGAPEGWRQTLDRLEVEVARIAAATGG